MFQELCTNRGTSDWCKAMFYLLNDVVQNCRKDKKHVCDAFYQPFLSAVEKLGRRQFDKWEKVIGSVFRVIGILKERAVYTPEQIEELKTSINWRPADGSQASSSTTSAAPDPNKVTPKKEEKVRRKLGVKKTCLALVIIKICVKNTSLALSPR